MKYSIEQLRQVKGIGSKTIERIIEQFDENEYVSEYDPSIHIEPNSLVNGDMLEVMNGIPDKSVDMILTDPPYMIDYRSGWRKDKFSKLHNDVNSYDMIEKFIEQSDRVLKDNGTIYIYCSWKTYPEFKKIVETKFNIKNVVIWNKNNHGAGDLYSGYAYKHEFVIYAQKGRRMYNGNRQADVQSYPKVPPTKMLHPTEKPVEMLENFIKYDTKEQDIVLDPFAGSGSTCVASKNTGRKYIGIELDKEYFEIAKKKSGGKIMKCDVCGLYLTENDNGNTYCEMCFGDEEKLFKVVYDTYDMFIESGFKDIDYNDFRLELGNIKNLEIIVDDIRFLHGHEEKLPYDHQKLSDLNKLYKDKNSDYGDAFGKSYEEYGDVAYFIRAGDKLNRLYTLLYKGKDRQVDDERVIDTVDDLINYTIMYGIEVMNEEFEVRSELPKYTTHKLICDKILGSGVDKVISRELHNTAIETLYNELAHGFSNLKGKIREERVDKMGAIIKLSRTALLLSEVLHFDKEAYC